MSNVHLLPGAYIGEPGEPNEEVIAACEALLGAAQTGEVVGIAFTAMHANGDASRGFLGRCNYTMLGALTCQHVEITAAMVAEDRDDS